MKVVEVKKIKDLRLGVKGRKKTKKQIDSARKAMTKIALLNNPMKNPDIVRKVKESMRGIITSPRTLFKKGNQYGKLNKNKKMSERQKLNLSLRKSGKKLHTEQHKKELAKKFILNNPMKDKTCIEHYSKSRSKKLCQEIFDKIVKEFNSGKSINGISKEEKIDRRTLVKILKRNGITFDANERRRIASLNNPNVRKTWFKKDITQRKCKEVQYEEIFNPVIVPFNPATISN